MEVVGRLKNDVEKVQSEELAKHIVCHNNDHESHSVGYRKSLFLRVRPYFVKILIFCFKSSPNMIYIMNVRLVLTSEAKCLTAAHILGLIVRHLFILLLVYLATC